MKRTAWVALGAILGLLTLAGWEGFGGFARQQGRPLSQVAPYAHRIVNGDDSANLNAQIQDYERRLKTNPEGQLTLATLAALYAKQAKLTGDFNLFDRAETLAEKSLSILKFFNEGAKLVIADIAQARHEFGTAVRLSNEVLRDRNSRRGPKTEALSILVTADLALGEFESAARSVDQLIDLDPSVSSHLMKALVLNQQGRDEDALHEFRSAYGLETFGDATGSARLRSFWGRFYLKQGKYSLAEGLFREALRIAPNDSMALGMLADLEFKEERYPEAESHYAEAFSASKQIIFLLGEVKAKSKVDVVAAGELRNQVEKILRNELKNPKSYAHRIELVKLLLDRGNTSDLKEALALAKQEVSRRKNPEITYYLALSLFRSGHTAEAHQAIEEVLRTGIHDPEYFQTASQIEKAVGRIDDAKYYETRALSLEPQG